MGMMADAVVITFPPNSNSPDSLISIYISNNWSGKSEHTHGNGMILLKNGNVHNIINGTIIAVGVERVKADMSIASVQANSVPT